MDNQINKNLDQITLNDFKIYLKRKGYQPNRPLLLSIDGDNTIVNRNRGSHYISPAVINMFKKLKYCDTFLVTMNTGRDVTNYSPIEMQTGHKDPNIFLAGRVIVYNGNLYTNPKAILPLKVRKKIWREFIDGEIPFLDVKSEDGNVFFVQEKRGYRAYYGHHRPIDWFNRIPQQLIEIDEYQNIEKVFLDLKIVRIEVPFLHSIKNTKVINAINLNNPIQIKNFVREKLDIDDRTNHLMFIPAPTHKSHGGMINEIGSIRILVDGKIVNKGTGLKQLAKYARIPEENIIYFGDSAGDKANDVIVKRILPKATLMITSNTDREAQDVADFILDSVENDGVPKAVDILLACTNVRQ